MRLAAIVVFVTATPAAAQSLGLVPERDLPEWLTRWSALTPTADFARRLPSAAGSPMETVMGRPRIGMFWTAGNPAAAAREILDVRADYLAALGRQRGAYRRPLDPGATSLTRVSAQSWAPLGPHFAAIGRVVADQERWEPGSMADQTEPYPTSPFVTTDSATTATRRTRVRIEGAAGWQLGRWAVGATLGYDTRENQTVEAGFVRRTRQTSPGLVVGVDRRVGRLEIGLHGQVRGRAETIGLTERAASGQVVDLEGWRDVQPLSVREFYGRRIDETARSGTVSIGGTGGRTHWVGFVHGGSVVEGRTQQEKDDPARDLWSATTLGAGFGFQRPVGVRGVVTIDARFDRLTGTGDRAQDSAGTIFKATEQRIAGRAEGRLLARPGQWSGRVAVVARHDQRRQDDVTAGIGANIRAISWSAAIEVGHSLSERLTAAFSVSLGGYGPTSTIPDPLRRGPIYRRFIAPELDIAARGAHPYGAGLSVTWRASDRTQIWLAGQSERLQPAGSQGPSGFGPSGSRAAGSLVFGVSVHPGLQP